MELHVLLWILGGGFAGTWGLCIFFMNRADNILFQFKNEVRYDIDFIHRNIAEIRNEISELKNCIKDHHARLSIIEMNNGK